MSIMPGGVKLLWASRRSVSRGFNVRSHSHPWWQFVTVTKGKLLTKIDNEYVWLPDESSTIIPEYRKHSFHGTNDSLIVELKFFIHDAHLKRAFLTSKPQSFPLTDRVAHTIDTVVNEGVQQLLYCQEIAELSLYKLLLLYVRELNENKNTRNLSSPDSVTDNARISPLNGSPADSQHQSHITAIIEYLNDHLEKDVSLETLSQRFGFTRNYLCDLFSSSVGISPIRYLTLLRIERAKEWLSSTTLPLKKISSLSGFNSPHHMWRIFQKEVGCSPSEFKKALSYKQSSDIHFTNLKEKDWSLLGG